MKTAVHNPYQVVKQVSTKFQSIPVKHVEFPREEWDQDKKGEGHHQRNYSHVEAEVGNLQLELLPKSARDAMSSSNQTDVKIFKRLNLLHYFTVLGDSPEE